MTGTIDYHRYEIKGSLSNDFIRLRGSKEAVAVFTPGPLKLVLQRVAAHAGLPMPDRIELDRYLVRSGLLGEFIRCKDCKERIPVMSGSLGQLIRGLRIHELVEHR